MISSPSSIIRKVQHRVKPERSSAASRTPGSGADITPALETQAPGSQDSSQGGLFSELKEFAKKRRRNQPDSNGPVADFDPVTHLITEFPDFGEMAFLNDPAEVNYASCYAYHMKAKINIFSQSFIWPTSAGGKWDGSCAVTYNARERKFAVVCDWTDALLYSPISDTKLFFTKGQTQLVGCSVWRLFVSDAETHSAGKPLLSFQMTRMSTLGRPDLRDYDIMFNIRLPQESWSAEERRLQRRVLNEPVF